MWKGTRINAAIMSKKIESIGRRCIEGLSYSTSIALACGLSCFFSLDSFFALNHSMIADATSPRDSDIALGVPRGTTLTPSGPETPLKTITTATGKTPIPPPAPPDAPSAFLLFPHWHGSGSKTHAHLCYGKDYLVLHFNGLTNYVFCRQNLLKFVDSCLDSVFNRHNISLNKYMHNCIYTFLPRRL